MPHKEVVNKNLFIKYTGLFDFEGLYRMMQAWFIRQRYEWHETRYKDKSDTPLGNEVEIDWKNWKRVTPYIKYHFEVQFHLWSAKEVEVDDGDLKRKLYKARMLIKLDTQTEMDWNNIFAKGRAGKLLGKLYWETHRREIELRYVDQLEYQTYDLHTEIKKYLGMYGQDNAYD
ncbi:MAG: hypothetical protein ABIH41_07115 [Nanoarchaeota archaeon]